MSEQLETIDEWRLGAQREIEYFCEFWKKKQEEFQEEFPKRLTTGEWDEQYRIYEI